MGRVINHIQALSEKFDQKVALVSRKLVSELSSFSLIRATKASYQAYCRRIRHANEVIFWEVSYR